MVDERFFAIVTDLIGTPKELVGEDGKIAWRGRSTVWGATTWNRDATAYTPLRFPGQYFDAESGLTRFDPLGLAPDPDCEEIDAQIKKARESWTSPASLSRHYGDHGRDLNIYDEDDYAMAADDLMSGSKPPDVREKESLMEGGTSTDANARRYWDEQPGLE
ncbi:RHS repeat domain-containing protein [Streptomyces sp. NPDC051546]|uniref:RHS repeat domain-containing protein n=1 Tax=Streptomyces sp. NPDC051546 TaxID=3365655 RepID=UPI0037B6F0AF